MKNSRLFQSFYELTNINKNVFKKSRGIKINENENSLFENQKLNLTSNCSPPKLNVFKLQNFKLPLKTSLIRIKLSNGETAKYKIHLKPKKDFRILTTTNIFPKKNNSYKSKIIDLNLQMNNNLLRIYSSKYNKRNLRSEFILNSFSNNDRNKFSMKSRTNTNSPKMLDRFVNDEYKYCLKRLEKLSNDYECSNELVTKNHTTNKIPKLNHTNFRFFSNAKSPIINKIIFDFNFFHKEGNKTRYHRDILSLKDFLRNKKNRLRRFYHKSDDNNNNQSCSTTKRNNHQYFYKGWTEGSKNIESYIKCKSIKMLKKISNIKDSLGKRNLSIFQKKLNLKAKAPLETQSEFEQITPW